MISAIKFLNITGLKHTTTETFTHLLMKQLTLNFQNDSEATGGMMTSSSPVASRDHANHTAQPVKDLEKPTKDISFLRCLEQLNKSGQNGSLAKTFVDLLVGMEGWYSTRCALTWKVKVMKSFRLLYQLQASTPHIKETEFSWLPTPATRDYKGTNSMNHLNQANGNKMSHATQLPNHIKLVTGSNSQLSPRFVMEMMGFPKNWTELPFLNGEQNLSKPEEMP